MSVNVETKCLLLAQAIIDNEPELNTSEHTKRLAKDIQDTVEQYIEWAKEYEGSK